jgi:hypothetical protein
MPMIHHSLSMFLETMLGFCSSTAAARAAETTETSISLVSPTAAGFSSSIGS